MKRIIARPVRVKVIGDAKEDFEKLNKVVGDELSRGITKSDHQILFKSIKQKFELLKENPQYGINIPKRKIPKKYIKLYEVTNLWKVNLPGAWRMIYTIRGDEVEILNLIVDIFDHKRYSKLFKYKK